MLFRSPSVPVTMVSGVTLEPNQTVKRSRGRPWRSSGGMISIVRCSTLLDTESPVSAGFRPKNDVQRHECVSTCNRLVRLDYERKENFMEGDAKWGYLTGRTAFSAATAEPRAPAMSRSATRAN